MAAFAYALPCDPSAAIVHLMSSQVTTQVSNRDYEADLVEAIARGDNNAALAEFYQRFAPRVMALLNRMLRSNALAQERHQDVFTELWRRAPQYDRKRASVSTWVMTVARSRALDTIRSQARRHAEARIPFEDVTLSARDSERPDVQAAAAHRRVKVKEALLALTPEQREVMELAYFGGLSHSEISRNLNLPLGTVKSRVFGAMKMLRKSLSLGGLL